MLEPSQGYGRPASVRTGCHRQPHPSRHTQRQTAAMVAKAARRRRAVSQESISLPPMSEVGGDAWSKSYRLRREGRPGISAPWTSFRQVKGPRVIGLAFRSVRERQEPTGYAGLMCCSVKSIAKRFTGQPDSAARLKVDEGVPIVHRCIISKAASLPWLSTRHSITLHPPDSSTSVACGHCPVPRHIRSTAARKISTAVAFAIRIHVELGWREDKARIHGLEDHSRPAILIPHRS